MKIAISISLAITVSLAIAIGGASLASYMVQMATQPHVSLASPQFTIGSCQPEYWILKTGEHYPVTATFTLANSGQTNAKVTVVFNVDGVKTSSSEFFVGANAQQVLTYQFDAEGCVNHQYNAQIDSVSQT